MDEKQFKLKARRTLAQLQRYVPELVQYLHELEAYSSFEAPRFTASHKEMEWVLTHVARELQGRNVGFPQNLRRALRELLEDLGEDAAWLEDLPEGEPGTISARTLEIARSTSAVVEHFSARLDPTWREILTEASNAGSWRFAATELVAVLALRKISVTSSERDDLRKLLVVLGEPTENIDRLVVATS
ncbi:hypothetical protein [Glycomyces terrestris]|uniref:Uncharacterized protein n=1 Tax=Glycomyces terrestris TaxID=2493553 RepID=A0A426URV5_9ACTN|nr:hypothetical protein [Glycomyces terrestris]RRR95563.1 hypothetical protein EIW28_23935 [Glycomyces terrestris]